MSSRHRLPTRTYRPEPEEHAAAVAALPDGMPLDTYLRACLRALAADPEGTLAWLRPYLPEPRPLGRPPRHRPG